MYTTKEIADWILSKNNTQAGDTISPLKLQKLIYYCQAWHLTIFGKPLFEENIEAWAHGPVVPSQYNRFAFMFRSDQIKLSRINIYPAEVSGDTKKLLDEVLSVYGEHSASHLEALTHQEDPWINARGGVASHLRSNEVITHKSMIDFYTKMKNGEEPS